MWARRLMVNRLRGGFPSTEGLNKITPLVRNLTSK